MPAQFEDSNAKELVERLSSESFAYLRQLHIWLGVGSAGAAIASMSLAASLPDPGFAIQRLLTSLWCFLIGAIAAGIGLFALAMQASQKGEHFAAAHNRSQANAASRAIPQMFSMPQRIADEGNVRRDGYLKESGIEHDRAESAWRSQRRWGRVWIVSLFVSSVAFVAGFAWPLAMATFYEESLVK